MNVGKKLALHQGKFGDLGFSLGLDLLEIFIFLEGLLQFLIQAGEVRTLLLMLVTIIDCLQLVEDIDLGRLLESAWLLKLRFNLSGNNFRRV